MLKLATPLACVLSMFVLFGCEEKEDDQIFSAQQCLDAAAINGSPVDNCVAMINGITTPKSYVIRCSADFMRQGIDNDAIVSAIEDLDKNDNTVDPTVTLYDTFAFDDAGSETAEELVETAVTNCTATGSKTLTVLALSAKTATTIKSLAGGNIAAWIDGVDVDNLANTNPDELENIGESVVAMHPIACGVGGQFEGTEVCVNLASAIASGTDTATIGQQFLTDLKDPGN